MRPGKNKYILYSNLKFYNFGRTKTIFPSMVTELISKSTKNKKKWKNYFFHLDKRKMPSARKQESKKDEENNKVIVFNNAIVTINI